MAGTTAAILLSAPGLVQLSLLGLFLLLEILPGVNWLRLYCIAMPGLILLVFAATRAPELQRYAAATGWIVVLCLGSWNTWMRYRQNQAVVALPTGRVMLPSQKYEKFSWLEQHTKPGDFFFQHAWHDAYFPLELRNPVFLDGLIANEAGRSLEGGQVPFPAGKRRIPT